MKNLEEKLTEFEILLEVDIKKKTQEFIRTYSTKLIRS